MARREPRSEFLKALSHTEKKIIYISIERIIEEVICYDNFRAYYFTYEFYFKTQKIIIILLFFFSAYVYPKWVIFRFKKQINNRYLNSLLFY